MNLAHLKASVDKTFVIKLLEHPPNAFHERRIHCLVVVLEIDPATQPCDVLLHISTTNNMNTNKLSLSCQFEYHQLIFSIYDQLLQFH